MKKITVDQSKVVKNRLYRLFRYFWATRYSTEKLIHAFVSSRIDSCNALLFGIPEKDISKLQIVQNSAARIVERARGRDPITPMLTCLHWLPVDKRIVYKIVLLCHKVIIHQSPTYPTNIITPSKKPSFF